MESKSNQTAKGNKVSKRAPIIACIPAYNEERTMVRKVFYGLPDIAALLVALFLWVWTLQIFAFTRQIVTNMALLALGTTSIGLTLLTSGVILWLLISVVRKAQYTRLRTKVVLEQTDVLSVSAPSTKLYYVWSLA
jgi:hypothetical protein